MKFVSLLIALAYIFTLATALPFANSNVKCQLNCDLQDYNPICGADDIGETKSFNNLCIMKTENCLRNLTFQKTKDGFCP